MSEFHIDTSGVVSIRIGRTHFVKEWRFSDLPEGVRGYVEAAYFTNASNGDDDGYEAFCEEHGEPGFSHLTPNSLSKALEDWRAFEERANVDLTQAFAETHYSELQAGRDFWFTRNGHGVGFWDRDALDWFAASDITKKLQDTLSEVARDFGEVSVVIDTDGGAVHFE